MALPGVADIRLFYAAAAVFFGCNAATVGSAESMPFCLLTAGDLSRLLWVHPKWPGLALGEMLLLCLPTGFFFASVAALVGSLSPQEHLATLVCCLLWLAALLTRSLLRLPGVEYVYPFLRFAGDQHGVWLWSKAALAGIGLLLWAALGLLAEKPPKAGPALTTPIHKPGKV